MITVDMIQEWRKRMGHNNAPGCVVCITLNMLVQELERLHPKRRVCADGVVITEE